MTTLGLRRAVMEAWPAMCEKYEGRLTWMYLDTKGLVTTGTGNLIDSVRAAQSLPWYRRGSDDRASDAEVEQEWRRVKALTRLKKMSGWAYRDSARLELDGTTVDDLLDDKTDEFWRTMLGGAATRDAAEFPADAQLALLDLAWQNGPRFLEVRDGDGYVWAGMRPAVLAQDWTAAARHVPGKGARHDERARLFTNAAQAVKVGADLDILWQNRTPTAPARPTGPKGPFMTTSAKKLYQRNTTAQFFTDPGEHTLKINTKGDVSLAVGPNDAVDVTVGARISSAGGGVLRLVLVEYLKDRVPASVPHHARIGQSFPAGADVEVLARYAGSIGPADTKGASLRLRAVVDFAAPVATDQPATVADVQSSGWTL